LFAAAAPTAVLAVVLLEPSAVLVSVTLPLAVTSRLPAVAFTVPPVMVALVSPVTTPTATAAARFMLPSSVFARSAVLPSLFGSLSRFSDSLLPLPDALAPPTVATAFACALRSLCACSVTLSASTEPPERVALVPPVTRLNATLAPLSPVRPSAVVPAVTVLVAFSTALPPACTVPPEIVRVGALCRMALATAASTESSSSCVSSGTVVSVDVTVDFASTFTLPAAVIVPAETCTPASETPTAKAARTGPRLKSLLSMDSVDCASSEMSPPVLSSRAPASLIVSRLLAVNTRSPATGSPSSSAAVLVTLMSPWATTSPVTITSSCASATSDCRW